MIFSHFFHPRVTGVKLLAVIHIIVKTKPMIYCMVSLMYKEGHVVQGMVITGQCHCRSHVPDLIQLTARDNTLAVPV